MVAVIMLFIGALNQTVANWGNLSSLTGLPSGLFYLAGVVSAVLMAATAAVRLIDPMQTGIARTEDAQ
jgi:TRAP-type C4-dicarboxylate transport system permease small subunit